MRLRLFRARGMAEAMALVRAELGADALILATRRVGEGVEVTAALEPPDDAPPPPAAAAPPLPPPVDAFAYHGVPPSLAALLRDGDLAHRLADALAFVKLPLSPGARPLLFAGPPGAGKTLTVARLATRLVVGGTAPVVVAADGQRAGAAEQLAAYTRLLGIELLAATDPARLAALSRRDAHRGPEPLSAPVLIDMAGSDPFDPAQREQIAGLAAATDASVVLVLPGGLDVAEAADLAAAFAAAGATMLVATRLDLSRRLGGVLAAAHAGGLGLTEAGIGPGATGSLVPLTPAFLAERLRGAPAAATAAAPGPTPGSAAAPPRHPPGASPSGALRRAAGPVAAWQAEEAGPKTERPPLRSPTFPTLERRS